MEQYIIKPGYYFYLFAALSIVYLLGLFVPLMDHDSAHHADIALNMFLRHDYVRLIDNGRDYLDKPHLHFWLSALAYNIFGVNTFAYKLPSFLMTCLGTYSTYRLGRLLYGNRETGLLSALIVGSAQAYILANNDVRMDALLTAFIIFGSWQLAEAACSQKISRYILGGLGMALAFSTKGMVGFVTPGIATFFLLIYRRDWKGFFNWRWLITLSSFILFISPVVYCYYLQFDLHPEKVIRGRSHISGVKFILWGQNTERLEGTGFGSSDGSRLFYLHTMLWAFLPWALIAYHAVISSTLTFIKSGLAYNRKKELLTLGTVLLIFTLISFSNFQLPHYLNIIFPFFAILTAAHLLAMLRQLKINTLRILLGVQYFVALVCVLIVAALNIWAFPVNSLLVGTLAILSFIWLILTLIAKQGTLKKLVGVSVITMILVNILLNGNFYPQLLNYQAGPGLARIANDQKIERKNIYYFQEASFSFNFYTAHLTPPIDLPTILQKKQEMQPVWVFTNEEGKAALEKAGLSISESHSALDYRITKLRAKFINPATRREQCRVNYLIKL